LSALFDGPNDLVKIGQYLFINDYYNCAVRQMDLEGFGNCTNTGACEAECPKGIKLTNIARLNREYYKAIL